MQKYVGVSILFVVIMSSLLILISAQSSDVKKPKTKPVTQTKEELRQKLHEHLSQLKGNLFCVRG